MIIITGASKGIGKFLYESYKSQGLDVIGTYHSSKVEWYQMFLSLQGYQGV